jgi:cytoskeleton protein RodZ
MTADHDLPPENLAPPPPPPPLPSPGTQLRTAREAAGQTVEGFAAQTKLAVSTLEALESDDFGALLEPVYVRGYYRKCARLLGLSEDDLIAAYNTRVAYEPPQPPTRIRLSASADVSSGGGSGRWLGLLLLVILVAALAYLFLAPSGGTSSDDNDEQVRALQPAPDVPSVAPSATPVSESVQARQAPAATATPTNVAPPPEDTDAESGAEAVLALAFREASWVRINDATGRALMNGLMDAGTRKTVRGEPPYEVFLGNAPGVELRFGEGAVDLAPVTQSNRTARLTLPATP